MLPQLLLDRHHGSLTPEAVETYLYYGLLYGLALTTVISVSITMARHRRGARSGRAPVLCLASLPLLMIVALLGHGR